MTPSKTLFFIKGAVPSIEDRELAKELSLTSTVVFRNVQWVTPEDGIEDFKELAGCVPQFYLDFQKKVEEVVVEKEDELAPTGDLVQVGGLMNLARTATPIEEIVHEAKATPPVTKAKRVKMDLNKKQ